jgi:hypothetical protein
VNPTRSDDDLSVGCLLTTVALALAALGIGLLMWFGAARVPEPRVDCPPGWTTVRPGADVCYPTTTERIP